MRPFVRAMATLRRHRRWARLVALTAAAFAVLASPAAATNYSNNDDPAAVSTGPNNMSFAYKKGTTIYTRAWTPGGWTAPFPHYGVTATSGPAIDVRENGVVDLFVRGADNALWHRYFVNGAWSNWGSLGGCLGTGPSSAERKGTGQLYVFALRCNGPTMVFKSWTPQAGWTGWLTKSYSSDAVVDRPTIISTSAGTMDLFWRVGSAVWWARYNGQWGSLNIIHGPGDKLTSGLSAVAQGPGQINVFGRGQSGNIQYMGVNAATDYSWDGAQMFSTLWATLSTIATSGPGAASEAPGRVTLFVRGGTNFYVNPFSSGVWQGWGLFFTP